MQQRDNRPGPHGRSEAVPQTATERLDQIRTGLAENGFVDMKGRYGWSLDNREGQRAMRSDLVWLLDHVDRLNTVLADEVPDVDGWTLYPTTDGGLMVSHDTDADRPTLLADDEGTPVGAVLAFIADHEGQADA